jgi:hypothetical protein
MTSDNINDRWGAVFAGDFVVNKLDNMAYFSCLSEQGFMRRLGLPWRANRNGRNQSKESSLWVFHDDGPLGLLF